MKIKISEDGKSVVTVEINGDEWRLKKPLPLSEMPELTKHISYVIEHFEFGQEQEWSDSDITDFLKKQLTDRQKPLMASLAQSEGWTPIEKLIQVVEKEDGRKAKGLTIAGLQASITRKCRQLKKENFWESKYVEQEDRYYYQIKPKYIKVVKDAL